MNLEGKIARYMNSRVLYVAPDSTLGEVAEKISGSESNLAVVRTEAGEVVGMVSVVDLFHAMRAFLLGADLIEKMPSDLRELRIREVLGGTEAREFMEACGLSGTNVCIRVDEGDTIANAIRVMTMVGTGNLLVTGREGVVGTLSEGDVVKAFTG